MKASIETDEQFGVGSDQMFTMISVFFGDPLRDPMYAKIGRPYTPAQLASCLRELAERLDSADKD